LSSGYLINAGPNTLFGGLKSTISISGRSSHVWREKEGIFHALHFKKKPNRDWIISYNNRYVEAEIVRV